jgi:CBS domain-containing protein
MTLNHLAEVVCHDSVAQLLANKGSHVWSVGPDITVYEAIARMDQAGVGALMVVSGGRLVGVISERDYARKIVLNGRSSRDTRVAEIMSTPPIFVGPEATVVECLQTMTDHRIRHLPVLDQGVLSGVISIGDLVNALLAAQAAEVRQLRHFVAGGYPG